MYVLKIILNVTVMVMLMEIDLKIIGVRGGRLPLLNPNPR
jgi:hypothetical protein